MTMRTKISTQYIQVLKMSIMSCSDFLKVLSMAMNLSVRVTYTLDMKDIIDEKMSCYLSLPMKKLYKVKEKSEIFIYPFMYSQNCFCYIYYTTNTRKQGHTIKKYKKNLKTLKNMTRYRNIKGAIFMII